jgi:hypothetical protein
MAAEIPTETEKLQIIKPILTDWDSELTPNTVLVIINGHGNCTLSEWEDTHVSPLPVYTALTAPIGEPSFINNAGVEFVKIFFEQYWYPGMSKRDCVTEMITGIKARIGSNDPEITAFNEGEPVFNDVSNEYRNRSWEFNDNYEDDEVETIHFMRKNPDGTIKHTSYNFEGDVYLKHTSLDGTHTIFKSDVLNYVATEFRFPDSSIPIECILIDSACNQMFAENRKNRKQFKNLKHRIAGIFGGNKQRHNLKRKTLKCKLRRKRNTKRYKTTPICVFATNARPI